MTSASSSNASSSSSSSSSTLGSEEDVGDSAGDTVAVPVSGVFWDESSGENL